MPCGCTHRAAPKPDASAAGSGSSSFRSWCSSPPRGAIPVLSVIPPVASHDFNVFLGSDAGQAFMSGNWVWFAVIVALFVFNTALGEELLFRGLLLPRMRGAFGRFDWVANGFLFAVYHLHEPWVIPSSLVDIFALSYPSRRYRSALIGIIVHSSQSVFLVLLLFVVLQ